MKIGQKIRMFFKCAGVISDEKRVIISFDESTVTTDKIIHPDKGGEENERFDRKTGRCLNDNTFLGVSRFINPI